MNDYRYQLEKYRGRGSRYVCPQCGRKEGEGDIGFERIRRITGYLVGTMDQWNNAKRSEESDRVKHSMADGELERL